MSHPELLILGVLRALAEVAMLFLLGQGLLALLAGSRRHDNTMYKLFLIITAPVLKIVRKVTPPLRPVVLALDRTRLSEAFVLRSQHVAMFLSKPGGH
jgi:uncharacterized protein YggT (Ycf19 family)